MKKFGRWTSDLIQYFTVTLAAPRAYFFGLYNICSLLCHASILAIDRQLLQKNNDLMKPLSHKLLNIVLFFMHKIFFVL